MKILGVNTGHDGHICLLEDGKLAFSHEAEKNSGQRYAPVSTKSLIEATLKYSDDLDAVAISGWAEGHDPRNAPTDGGYLGLNFESREYKLGQNSLKWTHCSHELSHIIASYALSPYADNKIAGGCGLNCEWNRMWEKSGLFDAVFVPPCTNDTGVGIGAAAATQHNLTGKVKIEWSVYSAQSFIYDIPKNSSVFLEKPLCLDEVSETLATGEIVCWVQGNCEIGPRALGNRSIIAAPFSIETTEKLNIIKERERYRPIAPICIEEDAGIYFEGCVKSKYMMSFYNVIDRKLRAITHIDGTARVQTVTAVDNPAMYDLLSAFKTHSGVGVLCNTSLNFKGRGFINSHSDIEAFCLQNGISTYVINQNMYRKAKAS
ncbi:MULTISPECIES: carbamoyltransferase C-terminal domain-containing protein [unclassified Pseudomonas]|uniref:carbamoyltransferase C-terminal domain-containing protein n=1 Tax=unclassified Pseudomonas TaxID=196821 RepID=UPI002B223F94|nr:MULTISPECIES: carbamoyltransferase C-terminal domain-containing protein [unclassified Pseudomonas]MEA9977666.1 carbamoyltransferase C-terminal domain-containing protein [Pseudomonas sp. RTS4]MEB0246529.1 carbamoyltransferase C-terminal domain-containing protein [Pseudomonas sp. 10S5]